jgi:hypothetical protein
MNIADQDYSVSTKITTTLNDWVKDSSYDKKELFCRLIYIQGGMGTPGPETIAIFKKNLELNKWGAEVPSVTDSKGRIFSAFQLHDRLTILVSYKGHDLLYSKTDMNGYFDTMFRDLANKEEVEVECTNRIRSL